MKILLDTHALLWWLIAKPQLSERARAVIGDGENEVFVSAASGWEIAIKVRLGRLTLPDIPERFIPEQLRLNAMQSLPILLSHALHVHSLPDYHRDPFDRILVAQSQLENLPIVSADPLIAHYAVQVIW
jgi:PIN domain nuclease of toxin-antitoxin system